MRRFDAIVVGAGPAGSTAAYRLVAGGASVLLLDRAVFPRDKPCGGGVTVRAARQLPFPIDPVVESTIAGFDVRVGRARLLRRADLPIALMTQRRRLDAHLAERAVEAGATFRDGVRVTAVRPGEVDAGGETFSAAVIIGADGANGTTARALGLATDRVHCVALEGNAGYDRVARSPDRDHMLLEFGTVPGGYGWAFPKGDHLNLGVAGWVSEGPRLRDHLARLCAAHGVDLDSLTDLRGHRLPMRRPGGALAQGCFALIGDAAGLVDPLSGDGMYEAFLSSRLAAEHALAILAGTSTGFEAYAADLPRRLDPLVRTSWAAKHALDRFPRTSLAVSRAPYLWPFVVQMLRGDVAAPRDASGVARIPLKLLGAIARRATARSGIASA
ncbi:MAG TPA: geranylgeranyl reductase family protein [Gaiellales bacterium]